MRRQRERYRFRDNLHGYLFASPWLLGFFIFLVGPMVFSVALSLYHWDGITSFTGNATFVGFDNFRRAFTEDRFFRIALYNTFYYALISVPLGFCTSMFLANLLNA